MIPWPLKKLRPERTALAIANRLSLIASLRGHAGPAPEGLTGVDELVINVMYAFQE